MRDVVMMLVILTTLGFLPAADASESNNILKMCLLKSNYTKEHFNTFDFNIPASCHDLYIIKTEEEHLKELIDFLAHNPRYRYPGQSNNRCFGKPREQGVETITSKTTATGTEVLIIYKDIMPQPCYEMGPWDERDAAP